jgi:hypothetical protein
MDAGMVGATAVTAKSFYLREGGRLDEEREHMALDRGRAHGMA